MLQRTLGFAASPGRALLLSATLRSNRAVRGRCVASHTGRLSLSLHNHSHHRDSQHDCHQPQPQLQKPREQQQQQQQQQQHGTQCSPPAPSAPPSFTAVDERHMRAALAEARVAYAAGEVPVGAVVLSAAGEVLATGHNVVESTCDVSGHAELVALRRAAAAAAARDGSAWRLPGATLYCTLEPCAMCLSALALARVRRVVYGAPDLRLGACGSWVDLVHGVRHPFHAFDAVDGGLLADESADLMRSFFRERRLQAKKRDQSKAEQ